MSSYKGSYSSDQSTGFAIPIVLIIFVAGIYLMISRSDAGFAGIILVGAAAVTMVYWTGVLRRLASDKRPLYTKAREQETKNWVYDLIKGDGEFVFVAEVPGPEDKITVRLIDGTLYIRGSSGFSRQVGMEGASDMQIFDFKYRNGVLTLRIK